LQMALASALLFASEAEPVFAEAVNDEGAEWAAITSSDARKTQTRFMAAYWAGGLTGGDEVLDVDVEW
jgi:hypothetical protein